MNLPDFRNYEPLNKLKEQMGIPRDVYGSSPWISDERTPGPPPPPHAYVLLKSGRRLDLLDPQPDAWTDEDLAIGLSRTYRWGGYSKWDLPLSVAQHSLTVLALREAEGPLTAREALRELLHDARRSSAGSTRSRRCARTLVPTSRAWIAACKRPSTSVTFCRPGPKRPMRGTSTPIASRRRARLSTSSAGAPRRCARAS